MKDLINEQPEQDIEHCDNCIHGADSVDICVLRKCKYAIAELIDCYEPKQLEQPWIPCSERLPEEDHWLGGSGRQFSDNVLISILNSDDEDEWVDVSHTIDGEWVLELPRHCKILAWMPLPTPYREE